MEKSGIKGVSVRTVNRLLNENGYRYLQARKKGLLSEKDRRTRLKFAKNTYKCHGSNFWTEKVAVYVDGVSFAYKRNPKSQAQAPAGKVWRRSNEGLTSGCTAKGSKCGTGGKYVRLIVAISYAKGVVACVPYEKMGGKYFASFLRAHFEDMIFASKKNSRIWIQDRDPCQNSAPARQAMEELDANLFPIPPRSPDINPIENIFHMVRKTLTQDAMEQNITQEVYKNFQNALRKLCLNCQLAM